MANKTNEDRPAGFIAKAIGPQLRGRFKAEVGKADSWVDESLATIQDEEPRLAKWLNTDPELQRLMTVNGSAIFWTLANSLQHGYSLEFAVERVDKLVQRAVAAAAFRAVMLDRDDPLP